MHWQKMVLFTSSVKLSTRLVKLPPIQPIKLSHWVKSVKNAFSGVGSLASPQQFSIKLEKCPATYTQAAVRFDGTEAPGGDGDLKVGTPLTAGNPGDFTGTGQAIAATGVGIRIFNQSDNSQVKLYNDSALYRYRR